ncbi:AsmA-like C-terminal region-containing protein [Thalassococcus sp. BH17M4-6]|uniref:YhdP family protein n=1 Tax=Thalassococcus sp. BH17M4-6 TaxID=3413148 RepID=UPI003BE76124
MSDQIPPGHVPPPRRRRKAGLWVLMAFSLLLAGLSVAVWAAVGRPVTAPDWLQTRIEARLTEAAPGVRLRFGRVGVVFQPDGLARVRLSDVDIATPEGSPVATLSEVEAALSFGALLRGQLSLREARLSGGFVTLQRDVDGRLGLALGQAFNPSSTGPDVPTLIAQVDRLLTDPRLAALREVSADALTLRYEDARARRSWTADGGRLRIERSGGVLRLSADLAVLGGGDSVASLSVNAESAIGRRDVDFGLALNDLYSVDIATQSPALAWLRALRAPISGALRGGLDEAGGLGPLNATLQIGQGVLQPNDRAQPVPFDGARTYFTYDPATDTLEFAEISVDSALGSASVEGRAILEGLDQGLPEALLGQFTLTGLQADPGRFLDTDVTLARAEMDFRLELAPFRLTLGRMRVDDPDLPVFLKGEVTADSDGWHAALDGTVARATPAQVAAYWPPAVAAKTRNWFLDNVGDAMVRDATLAVRAEPDSRPALYIDFAFEDADVRFARTLPRITGGAGQFTLIDNRLSVMAEAGTIVPPEGGAIDIAGSTFVVPDTRRKPADGQVQLAASGAVTAFLSFLDQEPLSVLQRAGRDVDLAEGRAEVTGWLHLPLRKGLRLPDMDFAFAGTLRDLSSDTVVPNRTLAAQIAALTVSPEQLRITGAVTLSGVPFQGSWTQPLGQPGLGSTVNGDVTITPESLAALGVSLPPGMVSGQGRGTVQIDLAKGQAPAFSMTSTLAGVGLSLPQVGWRLSPRGTGRFAVRGSLGSTPRIDALSIVAAGLNTSGRVVLGPGAQLDRIVLDRVRLGGWLDAPVTLVGRGRGAAPAITVSGGRMDLRQAPFGGGGGNGAGGGGGPITLALDSLQISSGITLQAFRGRFDTRGGLRGDFTAQMGRKAPIRGQVLPQNGRTAVRIAADDAGRVLAAAGLLQNVQGGALTLNLTPVPGTEGQYDGALEVREPRLRDAPAIASLLDAISVVGLLDQLEGPGIYFSEVDARFRLTPSQVILSQSSATGPSMGISMDGYYNLGTKQLDMQGVVSPIYVLNSIGSFLTRKGEGLIGFNFTLSGPTTQPRVAVNPLSVFTPGMFREIFRRAPPDTSRPSQ